MNWVESSVLVVYFFALSYLCLYSLGQLHLTIRYLRQRNNPRQSPPPLSEYPNVTIQLPVYNERFVVERLIDTVCAINYPSEKLEIQVLDDSTDETIDLVAAKVMKYRAQGLNISHIQRPLRKGFKAGALAHGLAIARGEFIAIFDADFLPANDFLEKTLPYFSDNKIGLVQTRWGHINKNYSLITRLQAFGLDAHFSIEQAGRNSVHSFINFNGTAGIWRKTCIEDAGGWSDDTLTEDLDLSYRAQLKGWQFKYLETLASPAELPIFMSAIKTQQYRWNKGAAETSMKNLGRVYHQHLPLMTKIHATFHLLNSSVFLMLLIVALLSLPLLFIKFNHPEYSLLFKLANVFMIGFFSIAFYFWVAFKKAPFADRRTGFVTTFFAFMSVSMGLSFHNGMAVLEGFLGRKSPFVRTPKFNASNSSSGTGLNSYVRTAFQPQTLIEVMLGIYFLFAIVVGIYLHDFGMIAFHAMLAAGFLVVSFQTIRLIGYEK